VRLALVLGGGGIAGVAWHTGVLAGLAASGLDVAAPSVAVGTSAGATVAAQLMDGRPLEDLVARQLDPAAGAAELAPPVPMDVLWERLAPIYGAPVDDAERRRMLGALALATETVPEPVRRAVLEARLDGAGWPSGPDRTVRIVAVDAATGARRVFDGTCGVSLVDAVAASSAVPGVWPPVTIGTARYVDGGIWSLANADLAGAGTDGGPDRVLVLAPLADPALDVQVAAYPDGVRRAVVTPDADSLAAFGADVLDPAVRAPAARAGLAQGRAETARVAGLLDLPPVAGSPEGARSG